MTERTIEWLKQQKLNKRFLVGQEKDRSHANDSDFESWILSDSRKHSSTCWGDGFETTDHNFSFCNQAPPAGHSLDDPFPFIRPIYARYGCPWENVTAVYEASSGYVYIFTSPNQSE